MTTEFLVTALIVVLIPGTGVLYTLSCGLFLGGRAAAAAAAGCTLGTLPHLAASILGLAALLHASGIAYAVVKYLGVAYLLYLAVQMWRTSGELAVGASGLPVRARTLVLKGVLINLLNPKLSLFFLAFLPQFVPPGADAVSAMLGLSAVFIGLTWGVFTLYGLSASTVRSRVLASPRLVRGLQRGFAGLFGALGLRLALADAPE